MSVLNQSGDEPVECPLCMEHLEVDDLNFYPCTCGYQICRFCWHRIRTDENGLCPACRKAYPENPADFRPLTTAEVQRLKSEKRLREQQRKQKVTESRQHLASVRVVQRNLVFVVGLPMRLADSEVLKKHEYFGKFGKIHKVVINQSTSYAGSQGPSASAYVTYQRAEDALRAIASVNNIAVDGRTLKASLGTTKYCSHFMKNQPCPKTECMYLHDLGDPEASFTKEDMQSGKHQEYEKKLHEQLINNTACQIKETNNNNNMKEAWPSLLQGDEDGDELEDESPPPPPLLKPARNSHKSESSSGVVTTATVNGVQANHKKRHTSGEEQRGRRRGRDKGSSSSSSSSTSNTSNNNNNNGCPGRGQQPQQQQVNGTRRGGGRNGQTQMVPEGGEEDSKCLEDSPPQSASPSSSTSSLSGSAPLAPPPSRSLSTSSSSCSSASSVSEDAAVLSSNTQDALTDVQRRAAIFGSGREESDNQSFFSSPYPFTTRPNLENTSLEWDDPPHPSVLCVPLSRSDDIPPPPVSVPATASSVTLPPPLTHIHQQQQSILDTNQLPDWQAAFNFSSNHKPLPAMQSNRLGVGSCHVDDDLGFDPFAETQKALAELIETEQQQQQRIHMYQQQKHKLLDPFPFPESRHLSHNMHMGSVGPPPPPQQHHPSQQQQQQQQHYPLQLQQSYRCTQDIMSCAASRLMDSFTAHCQNVPPAPSISRPPPPPGFATSASNSSIGAYNLQHSASKILPFVNMQQPPPPPQQQQQQNQMSSNNLGGNNMMGGRLPNMGIKEGGTFSFSDWQAILPNLGAPSTPNYAHNNGSSASQHRIPRQTHKDNWQNDWTAMDPAIVTATPLMSVGMNNEGHSSSLFPWVKSTENNMSGHMYQPNNHNISSGWPVAAAAPPPPGFSHPLHARVPAQVVERATIENL